MSNGNDEWSQPPQSDWQDTEDDPVGDWGSPQQSNQDEDWGQPVPQPGPAGQPTTPPLQSEQRSAPPVGQASPQQQGQVGQPGGQMTTSGKKKFPDLETNDFIVLALSFVLPGSGHIMLGQVAKGALILAAVFITCGAGYILNLLIVADAFFCLAKKKEHGVLEDWDVFPNYQDYI